MDHFTYWNVVGRDNWSKFINVVKANLNMLDKNLNTGGLTLLILCWVIYKT